MNTTVPWNMEGVGDGTRNAAPETGRRSGQSRRDWLDDAIAERSPSGSPGARQTDHRADMEAIAAELARMTDAGEASRAATGRGRPPAGRRDAPALDPPRFDARAAIRDAVVEIARRQADLDGHGEAPGSPPPRAGMVSDTAAGPASKPTTSRRSLREIANVRSPSPEEPVRPIALSAEVSQTFARFSRDLYDAIQATDARPDVAALDRRVSEIGHAIDGLGAGLPTPEVIARIGEQTREMRDLLQASAGRSVPLDALERQVASLESRLAHLAVPPSPATPAAPPPDFGATMAEVRALLDGLKPDTAMAALDSRLDDFTSRIERGLAAQGPAGLLEGLSRRVDEIHASLRSQLADSAVDTRPLEGLVRGLSDRIGQARDASADFQQLETAMRDVAAKIDGAASGMNPRAVQAIEGQLTRLADRLDRSDASVKTLDGVEQSLSELFSQFEVTRQVAIDAAETAARTAARDTLRAALQNPSLSHRPADGPAGLAEQVARGLDDLRAMQDQAERRTQTTLADIRATVEHLAQGLAGHGPAPTLRTPAEETRRRRAAPSPSEASRVAFDPADMLIEPGLGAAPTAQPLRAEPRFAPEPEGEAAAFAPSLDSDGPASFIAAARRAAQAAQASVASAAAEKSADRRPSTRSSAGRDARRSDAAAVGQATLGRARAFLAQRRRPILLGLAALVMLVGALEVVKLGIAPGEPARTGQADTITPARPHLAAATTDGGVADTTAKSDAASAAVAQPAASPARPALPTFVAGSAKAPVPAEGLGDGLRNLASAGDAGAQYEAGLRYADGRGVTRDPKQAVAWFQKAAGQGSAPAEYRLGSAYEKGVGVDRDPILAMSWYGKAAEAGNIRAMHNLAVMSAEGAAGKPDYAKAAQWFGKASTYGVRDSQFNLAILCARGLGIEQSLAQSYTWFAIAAAGGDDDAAKKRDEVGAKLDPKVLASAKSAAAAFRAAAPATSANEVAPPPGGWDAAAPRAPGSAAPSSGAKVSQL